jgi:hypothetical protein
VKSVVHQKTKQEGSMDRLFDNIYDVEEQRENTVSYSV